MSESTVFSYHTFLYPFLWNDGGKVPLKTFLEIFDRQPTNWTNVDLSDNAELKSADLQTMEDLKQEYTTFQYFNQPARKAIYGLGREVVHNYSFRPQSLRGRAKYIIKKAGQSKKELETGYALSINAIKLKIFNTGAAVLVFELKNHEYPSMDDVKLINEFGRRVSAPFIADKAECTLCADELCLELDSKNTIRDKMCVNISKVLENQNTGSEEQMEHFRQKIHSTYISHIILNLLTQGTDGSICFTSDATDMKKGNGKKYYYIEPALDDRMFVCCAVNDATYAASVLPRAIRFMDGETPASEAERVQLYHSAQDIYSYLFIDKSTDDCSCRNEAQLRELLKKHLYLRWSDYGTVHGVSHQSLICVAGGSGAEQMVFQPFLTEYVQMMILVLAQRASIMALEQRAARITGEPELQKSYIQFQNQLLFFEVTPQEQGVEIYERMQSALYISREKELLEAQLHNLYEMANVNIGRHFNVWVLVFAIAALIPAIIQTLILIFKH